MPPLLPPWLPWLPWLEVGVLLACAVGALIFQATLPRRLPTERDQREAAEVLKQEAQPGDVVLLFPWWTEHARMFLPDGLPVVGYLHEEQDDLVRAPRIWVLAAPRLPYARTSRFEAAFLPGREKLGSTRAYGALELTLYRNGRARPVLFSAVDLITQARVYEEAPDGQQAVCAWDGKVHHCPNGATVGAEWHELFYAPRRCVTLHPPGGNRRLVAEYPEVPEGGLHRLEGGVIWEHAPPKDVTPLHLAVEEASTHATLASLTVPPGGEGFLRVDFGQGPASPPRRVLRVTSQSDDPRERDACFELQVLGEPTP